MQITSKNYSLLLVLTNTYDLPHFHTHTQFTIIFLSYKYTHYKGAMKFTLKRNWIYFTINITVEYLLYLRLLILHLTL